MFRKRTQRRVAVKSFTQINLYPDSSTYSTARGFRTHLVVMKIYCVLRRSTAGSHPRPPEGLQSQIPFAVSKGRLVDKLRPMASPKLGSPCVCSAAQTLLALSPVSFRPQKTCRNTPEDPFSRCSPYLVHRPGPRAWGYPRLSSNHPPHPQP